MRKFLTLLVLLSIGLFHNTNARCAEGKPEALIGSFGESFLREKSLSNATEEAKAVDRLVAATPEQGEIPTMNASEETSDEKEILTFNIAGFAGVIGTNTIDVSIGNPFLGLDITNLTPLYTNADFSTVAVDGIDQTSGISSNDFTSPVTYTVTAENGTTIDYIVSVSLTSVCDAQIDYDAALTIDETIQTWNMIPPAGETVSLDFTTWNIDPGAWFDVLTIYDGPDNTFPVIGSYDNAIDPNPSPVASTNSSGALTIVFDPGTDISGLANNGTQFTADVTCNPLSTNNDFLTFTVPEQLDLGSIDTENHSIDIEIPFGVLASSLFPAFVIHEAATIDIGGVGQISGTTEIDFSEPVIYTITAQDGSTQDWTVTVTVATSFSASNDMLSFGIDGYNGTIDPATNAIDISISPFSPDLSSLTPEFTISPYATLAIAGTDQESGVTSNDYTSTVTYTVTAQDGSTQDWFVTVSNFDICGSVLDYDAGLTTDETIQSWTMIPPVGEAIQLDFTTWNIDPGIWYDIVTIYDGSDSSAPLIGSYDDTADPNPSPVVSTASNGAIYIEFDPGTDSGPFYNGTQIAADITCIPESSENNILTFALNEQLTPAVIDTENHTIAIEIGFGIDLSTLIPMFTISDGSTIDIAGTIQESGVSENSFVVPVTYMLTAQNGAIQDWLVTLTVSPVASGENDFLTFSANGIDGTIDADNHTVSLDLLPFATNLTMLAPEFTVSPFSVIDIVGVAQTSGVDVLDFTSPIIYTITAQDGSQQDWTVTIGAIDPCGSLLFYDAGLTTNETIQTFLIDPVIPGEAATIDFTTWNIDPGIWFDVVTIYDGPDVSSPLIGSYDDTADPNPGPLSSTHSTGALFIHFDPGTGSGPLYNGSQFGGDISCAPGSSENDFLTFSLAEQIGPALIDTDDHTVEVEVTFFGTDLSLLTANFTPSLGSTVTISGVDQLSGVTENNFTSPLIYTITAQDGTTQDWIVTITISAVMDGNDFISFSINGIYGTIGTNTVDLEIPAFDSSIDVLVPEFLISPFSTIAIAGVNQESGLTVNDFTNPVTYTITTQDGAPQDWLVTVTVANPCGSSFSYDSSLTIDEGIQTWYIIPPAGQLAIVDFPNVWNINQDGWYDVVSIYDGPDATYPLVGSYDNVSDPNPGPIQSTDATGALTVVFDPGTIPTGIANNNTQFVGEVTCGLPSSENDFLYFSYLDQAESAFIDTENHTVELLFIAPTGLGEVIVFFEASFLAEVTVDGVIQESGITPNSFYGSVVYTIEAFDGSTQDWTVTFSSPAIYLGYDFYSYSINGVNSTIGENTVDLHLDGFANLSLLTAVYGDIAPATVAIDGVIQESGVTVNDFSNPVTYTITSYDGSTKDYIVTVGKDDVCDANLDYPEGADDYLINQEEEWWIQPETPGELLTVSFNSFEIESGSDFLYVYEGVDDTGTLLAELSGTALPDDIVTSVGLYLKFTSDDIGVNGGFDLDVMCGTQDASLELNVLLEGPFDSDSGMMSTALRDGGHLPLIDPYLGTSTLAADFFDTGDNLTVVDWVEIEIRQAATAAEANETTIVERFNGLLLSDGSVVAEDGQSNIILSGITDDIFVVVNHRNHLSVMSATAISAIDGLYTYDFTSNISQTYQSGCSEASGTAVMTSGDVNGDGIVKYVGADNDSVILFNLIDGNTNLNNTEVGYYGSDLNLDGMVKFVGADSDDIIIFNKIDGNTNFNNTVTTTTL